MKVITWPIGTKKQMPDLFAGKMHALLCRQWKNRVKGRDWYDLVWYVANFPQLHLSHLEERMRQSGHWQEKGRIGQGELVGLLTRAIETWDVEQAKRDVIPFVKDTDRLDVWSRDFFQVVLGPRQVGKTTGLSQVVQSWPGTTLMVSADELITPSVDFVLELDGRLYAIEVKSGRKRNRRGLEKFVQRFPDSVPVLIDWDMGHRFLETESVDDVVVNF